MRIGAFNTGRWPVKLYRIVRCIFLGHDFKYGICFRCFAKQPHIKERTIQYGK
jgi:hypothetical protein